MSPASLMFTQIKDAVTLSQVASSFNIPISKSNGRCSCPFEDCQDPKQFRVWNDRYFKCYRCGRQGSIFDLLIEFNHLTLSEAAKAISSRLDLGIQLRDYHQGAAARKKAWDIYQEVAQRHWNVVERYAHSRGWCDIPPVGLSLSPTTLSSHKLPVSYLQKGHLLNKQQREYYYNHLIFPVYNSNGDLVHFNARSLDPESDLRWMSSAGQPGINNFFYNSAALYQPQQTNYLMICEGVSDCVSLMQLEKSTIAQFGVQVSLVNHHEAFSQFDALIALYDRDKFELGREKQGQYKSWGPMLPSLIDLMSITRKPVYYLMTPDEPGIKDINDWLRTINYDQKLYAAYGSENLRPLSQLAIEVYGDQRELHSYIWKCLAVEKDEANQDVWFSRVKESYGGLENYLLAV